MDGFALSGPPESIFSFPIWPLFILHTCGKKWLTNHEPLAGKGLHELCTIKHWLSTKKVLEKHK
jgi:hypothetical protein